MRGLRKWLGGRLRKKGGSASISPAVPAATTTSRRHAPTDTLQSCLLRYSVADFARAMGGEGGPLRGEAFEAVLDAYLKQSSPDNYGRLLSAMRTALIREAEYRRLRLTRLLSPDRYRQAYWSAGLTGDRKRDDGLEKAALRRLLDARRDLEALERPERQGDEAARDGFLREVAAVSRRMGFGIDIDKTRMGTYIGYLEIINAENAAIEAEKAKKRAI